MAGLGAAYLLHCNLDKPLPLPQHDPLLVWVLHVHLSSACTALDEDKPVHQLHCMCALNGACIKGG
jgi:hypothetical protein